MVKRLSLVIVVLVAVIGTPLRVNAQDTADLAAIKDYTLEHAQEMKAATEAFLTAAEAYYAQVQATPYETLWDNDPDALRDLIETLRQTWMNASLHYELDEGIIAGVPSLAYYDTLLDAGPPASESPEEALEWTLTLPDGTELESPGNLFHNLSEPALFGTNEEYVALEVDLDGDGEVEFTEVLPDANFLLGVAQRLDQETGNMIAAVEAWEPTLEDAFTALLVMIPTMNEYFGQWRESAFIAGSAPEEAAFVAVSRLFDIQNILTGLDLVYQSVAPVVAAQDAELDEQIRTGFADLIMFITDLYAQEQEGVVFSAEEVDLFGAQAQDQAETLAAQVAQGANLAELTIVLE